MGKTFYIIFRIRTSIGAELKIARLVLKDAAFRGVGGLKPASPKKNRLLVESLPLRI